MRHLTEKWRLLPIVAVVGGFALVAVAGAGGVASPSRTEVVVTLRSPAVSLAGDRAVATRRIAREQRRFVSALHEQIPEARVRWRYRLVANGVAVVLPSSAVDRLRGLPDVRSVDVPARYRGTRADARAVTEGPREIGASALWGQALENQGQGMKIAIIDDGLDWTHPYFDPTGYTMPPGFPRGQKGYTSAKVIVARAFPPPNADWKYAGKPFDPDNSDHATHVAGIAAGNAGTKATGGQILSGVAPRAYIGNYRALTVPTDAGVGLDGNAPEIVAAIEAAVGDGMNVINLSIGEPEIEPSRDLVALALDAAAAAGVVPVVAAGNDYATYGRGSVTSPGNSEAAITVAATSDGGADDVPEVAGFSSAGPTAISLRLKPDVAAPGSGILSSFPRGEWRTLSGTSMAAPHVAGAAALLRQRHPEWSVAQLKAALVGTAKPVSLVEGGEAPPTRAGAGLVDLAAAANPLLLATPSGVSFGYLQPDRTMVKTVDLADAGGGAGMWNVTVSTVAAAGSAVLTAPAQIAVPGPLPLTLATTGGTNDEISGIVTLEREGVTRRVPYWARIVAPALGAEPRKLLTRAGVYAADTRGGQNHVERYLYPDLPADANPPLRGPEKVFRVRLQRSAANLGVVVLSRSPGTEVEPRIVAAGNESRLEGYAALPRVLNPYLEDYESAIPASGVLSPLAGVYDIVFDSTTPAGAGAFTFRLWIDDVKPPTVDLRTATVRRDQPIELAVADAGSGIAPSTITATIDGTTRATHLRPGGIVRLPSLGLAPGPHRIRVQVSDVQETRNNENVGRVLPNTTVFRGKVVVEP